MFFYLIKFLFILFSYGSCQAIDLSQKEKYVEVQILPKSGIFKVKDQLFIGVELKLKDGWKTYWKNPGDAGEAISVNILEDDSKMTNLPVLFPFPKTFIEKGITTIGYENHVIFPVRIPNFQNGKKKLNLEYLICKDICIPVSETKIVDINVKNIVESSEFIKNYQLVPKRDTNYFNLEFNKTNENKIILDINKEKDEKNLKIFGYSEETDLKVNKLDSSSFEILIDEDFSDLKEPIYISISDGTKFEEIPFKVDSSYKSRNIFFYILMALIGGFILNFMPCVLPILSLKLYSFSKLINQTKQTVSSNCLLTISGIICSFLLLASVVIVFKIFGESLGWGFQFQNFYYLLFISIIIFIFSLNLIGFFEIILPETLLRSIDKILNSESKFNHFFSGAFATLLATPCSAPFLGTAVGFSMAASNFHIFTIFFFISIGFALPYFGFYFFPKIIGYFPKPGKWMLGFKSLLGLLLLISAAWFFTLLKVNSTIILIIFLSILLLAFIRNKNTNNKYIFLTSLLLSLVIIFYKYDTAKDVTWEKFTEDSLSKYINKNKVILVDVTADWCVTCQFNKITTLNSKSLINFINENKVVTLRADWTNKNNEIFEYIKRFNRYGIPVNIIYGPNNKNGILLPEIISKDTVMNELIKVNSNND